MSGHFRYFVEGPCERAIIKAFMFCDGNSFYEGQVEVFNFINEKMSNAFARTISRESKVAIIIDTDVESLDIFEENIKTLQRVSLISLDNIYIILSINNFEDELVYSCSKLSSIHQLLNTKGINEFKKKFIAHKNINKKLLSVGFDLEKIWSRNATNIFNKYNNSGKLVKKIKQESKKK